MNHMQRISVKGLVQRAAGSRRPHEETRKLGRLRAGRGATLMAVGLVGLALSACGSSTHTTAAASSNVSTITFDRSSDLFGFDPVVDGDQTSISTDLVVYDRLVEQSQDGKQILPGLASSWKVSDGGRTYTFTLRPGVKFSDGTPMSPADVVFSLARGTNPNTPYGVLFGNAIKKIVAVGSGLVQIQLKHPFSPLIPSLSTFIGSVYSQSNYKKWGKAAGLHPLGTGPYMLEQWVKGSQLTLVRNPYYWGTRPAVSTIVMRDVPDASARVLQLISGAAQAIDTVSPNEVAQIKSSGAKVENVFGPSIQLVYLNEKYKPFADVNVRRALAFSIDKQAIAQTAFLGLAQPALSAFPVGTFDYTSQYAIPYDMQKAKQALAQSAYPHGFSFQLIVPPGSTPQSTFAQIWSTSLTTLGIKLSIVPLEQTTGYQKWTSETYQATTNPSWVNDTPDPFEFSLFSLQAQDGQYTHWHSATGTALAAAAQVTGDPAVRLRDYSAIQQILAQQVPFLPVVDLPVSYASSASLTGFSPAPNGAYHFESAK